MHERQRIKRLEEKEDFIDEVKAVHGCEPQGLRQILGLLSHPDMIGNTVQFFEAIEGLAGKNSCKHYEFPWDCAREAEAKYETIKYGWVGAGVGVGFDESWCEPCRKRVLRGTLD